MLNIKIFYGTQTGNARDVGIKLYQQSLNLLTHDKCSIKELDEFSFSNANDKDIYVFICSTTGQGDTPDNMNIFWKSLMSQKMTQLNIRFCIFGLGDSKYSQYNFVAKKLFRRLIQLKAHSLLPIKFGDDQNTFGIDETLIPWMDEFWKLVKLELEISTSESHLVKRVPCFFDIEIIPEPETKEPKLPESLSHIKVESNIRVTAEDHFQSTHLISFLKSSLQYSLGNVLTVFPYNFDDDVELFFELTNIKSTDIVRLSVVDLNFTLPLILSNGVCSVFQLVKRLFDLNSIPRKTFFENLAMVSEHPMEKERLLELANPVNLDELYEYCFQPRRILIEVLQDFPNTSAGLTLTQWINVLPFIRPRDYSIASSPNQHENIDLLVSLVQYRTKMSRPRKGLCSGFLCGLRPGIDTIVARVKHGTLTMPPPKTSLILVAPGTGIAAMRGLIHERTRDGTAVMLFFGCRYANKDFYFRDEFEAMSEAGRLQLVTAFSRQDKVYVQHRLRRASKEVFSLMAEHEATVLVCGRADQMPDAVIQELGAILRREGGLTQTEADRFLSSMRRHRRLQLETWS